MKLQRTKPFSDFSIGVRESLSAPFGVGVVVESVGPTNHVNVLLDEREVSDLITMLQYYKLQVWPDGA